MADMYATLRELLEAVAAGLPSPPQRRYVADGEPAADCEQLTVHLGAIQRGTVQSVRPDLGCAPTTVTAVVTRFWCVPVPDDSGAPPSAATLDRSGAAVSTGALELWNATAAAAARVACRPALDEAVQIPPSGGYVGWAVVVRFTL